mgnify:CR=1 FL=1
MLGTDAWNRLPEAVRERFADTAAAANYAGAFEIVRASALGRVFAWLGTLFGTPVAPRAGTNVAARVLVRPDARRRRPGIANTAGRTAHATSCDPRRWSTNDGQLIEKLPARLCMPLDTYEEGGVLHFVSRGYYFRSRFGTCRLWLPAPVVPGVTHVEHIDLGHGWFRFTMTRDASAVRRGVFPDRALLRLRGVAMTLVFSCSPSRRC